MGKTTPVYNQQSFAGYIDGTESGSTSKGTNTNFTQDAELIFQIRFLVQETAGGLENNKVLQLEYNYNSGGWNDVNAASSVVRSTASDFLTEDGDTTQRLGAGTFITPNGCVDEVDGVNDGTVDFAGNDEVEVLYSIRIIGTDVTDGLTIQLRVKGLDGYTNTPTITINKSPGVVQVGWAILETPLAGAVAIAATITAAAEAQYDGTVAVQISATITATAEPQYMASVVVPISATITASAEPQYEASATVLISATISATAEPQFDASVVIFIAATISATAEPQYEAFSGIASISLISSRAAVRGYNSGPLLYSGELFALLSDVDGGVGYTREDFLVESADSGANWSESTNGDTELVLGSGDIPGSAQLVAVNQFMLYAMNSQYSAASRLVLGRHYNTATNVMLGNGFDSSGDNLDHSELYAVAGISVDPTDDLRAILLSSFTFIVSTVRYIRTRIKYSAAFSNTGSSLFTLDDLNAEYHIRPGAVTVEPDGALFWVFFDRDGVLYFQNFDGTSLGTSTSAVITLSNTDGTAVVGAVSWLDTNTYVLCVALNSSGILKSSLITNGSLSASDETIDTPLIATEANAVAASLFIRNNTPHIVVLTSSGLKLYKYVVSSGWSLIGTYDFDSDYRAISASPISTNEIGIVFSKSWDTTIHHAYFSSISVVKFISATITASAEPQYDSTVVRLVVASISALVNPFYNATSPNSVLNITRIIPATAEPRYEAKGGRLPDTIASFDRPVNGGYLGPFVDPGTSPPNQDTYFIGVDTTNGGVGIFKNVDPDSTAWTIANGFDVGNNAAIIYSLWCENVSDELIIFAASAYWNGSLTTYRYSYTRWNMSSNTFDVTDQLIYEFTDSGNLDWGNNGVPDESHFQIAGSVIDADQAWAVYGAQKILSGPKYYAVLETNTRNSGGVWGTAQAHENASNHENYFWGQIVQNGTDALLVYRIDKLLYAKDVDGTNTPFIVNSISINLKLQHFIRLTSSPDFGSNVVRVIWSEAKNPRYLREAQLNLDGSGFDTSPYLNSETGLIKSLNDINDQMVMTFDYTITDFGVTNVGLYIGSDGNLYWIKDNDPAVQIDLPIWASENITYILSANLVQNNDSDFVISYIMQAGGVFYYNEFVVRTQNIHFISTTIIATAEPQYVASSPVAISATLSATAEPQYIATAGFVAIAATIIGTAEPQYDATATIDIIYRNSTKANIAAGTSITLDIPAGTVAGDFLIAGVHTNGGYGTVNPVTGWTLLVENRLISNPQEFSFYRVADGTEGATVTFSWSNSLVASGILARYSYVDQASPIDASPVLSSGASTLNPVLTGITSITNRAMIAAFIGPNSSSVTTTPPASLIERAESDTGGKMIEHASDIFPTAGFTGNQTFTFSGSREYEGFLVALKPTSTIPINIAATIPATAEPQYDATVIVLIAATLSATAEPQYDATVPIQVTATFTAIAEPQYDATVTRLIAATFIATAEPQYDATVIILISATFIATAEPQYDATSGVVVAATFIAIAEPQYDATVTRFIAATFIAAAEPQYDATVIILISATFIATAEPQYDATVTRLIAATFIATAEPQYDATSGVVVAATFIATAEPQYDATVTRLIAATFIAIAEPQYDATVTRLIAATFIAIAEPQYDATVIRLIAATFIATAEPQYDATVTRLIAATFIATAEPQYDATVTRLIAATFIAIAEPQYDATVTRLIAATFIAIAEPQYDATIIVPIAATIVVTAEPQYAATAGYLINSAIITATAEPQYEATAVGIDALIIATAEPQYDAKLLGVYVTLGIIAEPQYDATVPTAIVYAAFVIEAEPQYEATLLFELIQSYPQHVVRYLAIAPRDIVYQAQTTGEFIFDNVSGGLTAIRFQNPIGTASDAEINMSVDIGTSQGGRELGTVRLRKAINESSGVIYINEISYGDLPITDGMYITVRDEFLPSQRMLRLVGIKQGGSKYINKFTEYHDYDIYYSNQNSQPQPIIIVEGQYEGYPVLNAGWVDPATGNRQVYFDCSKTFFPSGGQTIVSYNWDFKDAVSITHISDTRKLVTFPPDFRYVKLTVVSNTGKFSFRYIPIWAFDGSTYSPLTENGTLGFSVTSDSTDQGRNMNFSLFGDPNAADEFAIPEGSLVCYFEDAYFGVEYLPAPFNYRSQFIGWATSDTVELKRTGRYTLEVGGMKTWLDRLGGFGLQLNSDASPQEWYELPKLNPDIIIAYVLREFSTVLELCNLYPFFINANWPDAPVHKEAINANSIWKQLDNLVPSYDVGQIACDSVGNIHLTFHPSYPSDTIDRPESNYRFKLTDEDLTDSNPINLTSYTQSRSIGKVDASGARWNGQAASIPVLMNSRAPGNVLGKSSGSDTLVFQRLRGASNEESQIRLNELSGHHYQRKNNQRGDLTINLIGNYDVFEPARGDLVQLNLPVENLRDLSIDPNAYFLVKKVSVSHNNQRGAKAKAITLTVEEVTAGVRGITQPVIINENEINPVSDDFWTFNPATQYPTPTPVEQLYEDVEAECIKVVGIDEVTEVNVCYALAWDIYSGDIADTASLGEEEVQWRSISPEVPNYKLADVAYYRASDNYLVVRAAFYSSTKIKIFVCDNTMTESPEWLEEITISMTGTQPSKVAIAASRNQDRWAVAWAAKDGVYVYKFNGSLWQGPILMGSDAYNDPDVTSSSQGFDICVLNNRVIAPGASGNGEYKLYVVQEGETVSVELPNTPTFNALVHCLEPGTTYEFYAAAAGTPSTFYHFSESTNPTVTNLKPITGTDIPGKKNALAIDRNNENIVIWTTALTETELRSQTESTLVASSDKVASISYPLTGRSYAALFANNGIFLGGGGDQIDLSIDAWSSIVDRYFNLLNAFLKETLNAIVSGCALLPPVEDAPADEDPIVPGSPSPYIITLDPGGFEGYATSYYKGPTDPGSVTITITATGNPGNAIETFFDNTFYTARLFIDIDMGEVKNIDKVEIDFKYANSIVQLGLYITDGGTPPNYHGQLSTLSPPASGSWHTRTTDVFDTWTPFSSQTFRIEIPTGAFSSPVTNTWYIDNIKIHFS